MPGGASRSGDALPRWYEGGYRHIWLPYTQMQTTLPPLPVVASEGVRLHLADGRELVDGVSSWWTACHGYNHPHIRAAVMRQLEAMPHVMFGGLVHEPALRLAMRLADLLPGTLNRAFFSESGSVSVEIAMKMAVQYWLNRGQSGRNKFISFRHGYHGDTLATMSICDPDEGMHSLFRGILPAQHVVPLPRTETEMAAFDACLAQVGGECAAVVMEPLVQGAGGMKFHDPQALASIAAAARRHGLLLILDEIMTGFGRTGTMFACEQAGICPDIVTLSKALTGGTMALAATVATEDVFSAFLSDEPGHALMHGPTYMANPLACAAANAALDLFETEPRLDQVSAIQSHLETALAPCRGRPGVVDVRVMGAIGVVQLEDLAAVDWFKARFVEEGVWIRPFGDIVYLMPPFVIGEEDLARLTGAVVKVVGEWSARRDK